MEAQSSDETVTLGETERHAVGGQPQVRAQGQIWMSGWDIGFQECRTEEILDNDRKGG